MRTLVYHNNAAFDLTSPFPGNFTLVAEVEVGKVMSHRDAADRAFELTNHIDLAWWNNVEVSRKAGRDVRSTSVGDVVVVLGRWPGDEVSYRCMSGRWEVINV